MSLSLTSFAFTHEGQIPKRLTCQGDDVSPAMNWDDVPEGTETLVLIVDDPDAPDPKAPKMTWVHWVLYNIQSGALGLHKVYALDTVLPDLEEPTKAELEKAMKGHVLEKTELMGTYQKE